MTAALLTFGRWPSGHDLDLLVDPAPPISRPFPADYDLIETAVTPDELPELGPLVGTLDRLSRTVPVPLDVFLDSKQEDFNLALWVEPGRPWLLSWRFCGRDFFGGAHPLESTTTKPSTTRAPPTGGCDE